MNTIFQAASDSPLPLARTLEQTVEACLVRTAEALSNAGAAADHEIFEALARVRESQLEGPPLEILETLARVTGHDEERLGLAVHQFSDAIAATLNPIPPTIPFAGKLIAPSAFYEAFDAIHKLGKALLTPVIFAEDTDAIGTASVNPIAAAIVGEEILYSVSKRFGIRPFITVARMEYESWAFLCRKHFEL